MNYEGIGYAHYEYRVRDRLRTEVLVPLRDALELPEVYMIVYGCRHVSYNRVASVAITNYSETFMSNDREWCCLDGDYEGQEDVAELQWKRMVDDTLDKGNLSNCIVICDVSGSMCGTPLEVSVALGLLVSESLGRVK
ncbi:hypothetical protein AgCh_032390 [Apium graveolens]